MSHLRSAEFEPVRRGQALVETVLVILLFALLMSGVLDFGRMMFTQLTVQHALREAGRFAVTGRHLPDKTTPGAVLDRTNSIFQVAQQAAFGLPLDGYQIYSLRGGTNSAGGPSDTVVISVSYNLRLLTPLISRYFPNGAYRFTASTSFKNEPFPPSQTN